MQGNIFIGDQAVCLLNALGYEITSALYYPCGFFIFFFLVLCMCGYAIISHTVILKNTAGRKMELKSLILS